MVMTIYKEEKKMNLINLMSVDNIKGGEGD